MRLTKGQRRDRELVQLVLEGTYDTDNGGRKPEVRQEIDQVIVAIRALLDRLGETSSAQWPMNGAQAWALTHLGARLIAAAERKTRTSLAQSRSFEKRGDPWVRAALDEE